MPTGRILPTELPQEFSQQGFSRERTPAKVETPTEAGFSRTRRRFTRSPNRYTGTMLLERSQVAIWENFYDVTLAQGALNWDWKDPISEQAAVVVCIGEEPSMVSEGSAFRLTFTIEIEKLE